MKKLFILFIAIIMMCWLVNGFAQEASKFNYVGVKKCKMCHKGEKKGKIFEKWQEQGHAKAFATLATEESKAIAKKMGIKEEPQQAKECLVCHVTAYKAAAAQKEALTMEEGVSCEACHGPGSKYKSLKVMKGITAGTMKGADYGLIEPDKKVCVTCHNEKSPTYKPFKFEEATKKIAHPMPAKK